MTGPRVTARSRSRAAPLPIFFAHYGDDGIRGSERVLLDLLTHLERDRFQPVLWCNQRRMADEARALGVDVRVTYMPILAGWAAPRFEIGEHRRLRHEARELIQHGGIRLVHANSGAPNQWLVPATRGTAVGYVTHLHSHYVLRDRCTMLLHRVPVIAACSDDVLAPFEADGVGRERLRVVPNGVDVQRIAVGDATRLRAHLGIASGQVVVTAAGALVPLKGFDVLVRALQVLALRGEAPVLLIAGQGPEEAALRRLVSECQLERHVHFLGNRNDVGAILRDATDVVAVPSRHEAFGLTIAEGAFFGVPAVASDVPGLRETIRGRPERGLLVPAGSPIALANALGRLARDPTERRAMGAAARAHACEQFTVQAMVSRMEALYETMVTPATAPTTAPRRGAGWQPWRRLGRQWVRTRLRGAERA